MQSRSGTDLIAATRPFVAEGAWRSWLSVLSTLVLLCLMASAGVVAPWRGARVAASVAAGLVLVRMFVLYHDVLHGGMLRGSWIGRAFFLLWGVATITPPRAWGETHNYHHAHTGRLRGLHIGSWETATVPEWRQMSRAARFRYRLVRHPLVIFGGYVTVFLLGMCISSFLRRPRRNWDSALALAVHVAGGAVIALILGAEALLVSWILPFVVAGGLGSYLFYAQHNYPAARLFGDKGWSYTEGAIESSSYMSTGPVFRWITANIGYHHVHHLNPTIPHYRLPEAMAAIPELQIEPTTSLGPRDVLAALRLKLWDPEEARLVGWRNA